MKPEILHKTYDANLRKETPGTNDMELINRFALEPLTEDQVYITRQRVCHDQPDRSFEKFTPAVLERFAETIIGKSIMTGHDYSGSPAGRTFDAEVVRDANGAHYLMTRSFTLANDPLTEKIKAGIARDVSIGFRADKRVCGICEKDYDSWSTDSDATCSHIAGRDYEGKTCVVTYSGDTQKYEALETSYVWLGCQPGAETVSASAPTHAAKAAHFSGADSGAGARDQKGNAMTIEEAQAKIGELEARVKTLEPLEQDKGLIEAGKQFLTEVKAKITELSAKLGQAKQAALYLKSEPALAELLEYRDELFKQYDEAHPPKGDGVPAPPPAPVKQEPRPGIRAGRLFGGRAA